MCMGTDSLGIEEDQCKRRVNFYSTVVSNILYQVVG